MGKISGTIIDKQTQKPVQNIQIQLWDVEKRLEKQAANFKTNQEGKFTSYFSSNTLSTKFGQPPYPKLYLKILKDDQLIHSTKDTLLWDPIKDLTDARIEVDIPFESEQFHLEGRIFSENRLPAEQLLIRLYNVGFGGTDTKLGETTTDGIGYYTFTYEPGDKIVNLELRAVDNEGKEISLNTPKFKAERAERLNLVVPDRLKPLAPEFTRLADAQAAELGGLSKLGEAKQSDGRQDLKILHLSTGWDARLIALAASAVKLSADTGVSSEALYGLFRVGLPTDKQRLAMVPSTVVEKALHVAKNSGIISLEDSQIGSAVTKFKNFARKAFLDVRALGTLSSYRRLLDTSVIADSEERVVFEDLLFRHRGTSAELWKNAREAGIPPAKIEALRLQGKLAFLTYNNVELTASLQEEIGTKENLKQMVTMGLYKPQSWKDRIAAIAGESTDNLDKFIPPAYDGETPEDRLDAYASDLARKVRLSFPTEIVTWLIENDELQLGERHGTIKMPVCRFLKTARPLDFALGRVNIDAFVEAHRDELFKDADPVEIKSTVEGVKLVQRLYQITPSDESMKVLAAQGFESASDIVNLSYNDFLEGHGDLMPSHHEAALVYRKAQQISAVTLSTLINGALVDSSPSVAAISPTPSRRKRAKEKLIKHFPTFEALFGSLDFCECEHCRSVLSPAAYFVDLLRFLDRDRKDWDNFLNQWKRTHAGELYTASYKKPYDALIERRPDLPHLPLTCENTNTVLPYIDIVNEILEYYVVHKKLDENAVHDTGSANTEELLAEPQYILTEAYETLNDAYYPLTLPFDLWLETVRSFLEHFDTPLVQVLERFRTTEELFSPPTETIPYDRAAIFNESLGVSPAEYAVFTDPQQHAAWHELYGYGSLEMEKARSEERDNQGNRIGIKAAKTLARRLGVTYRELTELVRTNFVNPQLQRSSILQKLEVDAEDMARFKMPLAETLSERDRYQLVKERNAIGKRIKVLAKGFNITEADLEVAIDSAWHGGDFDNILVLAAPTAVCDFNETTLRYAGGAPADGFDFLRLNLFVRLWRKLGWTMEELDRALETFLPKNLPLTIDTLGAALKTALVYLAHLKTLDERVSLGKNSKLQLLTLWADMPTSGKSSLYSQLFLRRIGLREHPDPVFDHPLGYYLCYFDNQDRRYKPFYWKPEKPEDYKTGNVSIVSHLSEVQAALNLTAGYTQRVLMDFGKSLSSDAELSLTNISVLHRYAVLAKALKLSIPDLITLKELSGINPFEPLSMDPLETIDDDHPFTHTLRFVEIVEQVRNSGFSVEDLDYILRHRFDPVGKYRRDPNVLSALVKTIAEDLRRIHTELTAVAGTDGLTDAALREKLALVLSPDVVDTFFGLWKDTKEYSANKSIDDENLQLEPTTYEKDGVRVSYDVTRQVQYVSHLGVLTDNRKQQILQKIPAPAASAPEIIIARYDLFMELLDRVAVESQTQAKAFFDNFFEGFIAYKDLYGEPAADVPIREKRQAILAKLLDFVTAKLQQQRIVHSLTATLNADLPLIEVLLTDATVLTDPNCKTEPSRPLLDAFTVLAQQGVMVECFLSTDLTGEAESPRIATVVNWTALTQMANSARFEGYLEVPVAGAYRFFSQLGKKGAAAELSFTALPEWTMRHLAAQDDEEFSDFVELKPGVLYEFTFEVRNVQGGEFTLLVKGETETLPKGHLNQLVLYPSAQKAFVLLSKVLLLMQGFDLSEREVRYLSAHKEDFDDLALDESPTSTAAASPEITIRLFKQFLRLFEYAHLKQTLAGGTSDLIGIFEHARCKYPADTDPSEAQKSLLDELYKCIAELTRRDADTVKTMAEQLGFGASPKLREGELHVVAPDFTNERGVRRLWDALQIITKLGVPVKAVERWTRIVNPGTSANASETIARELRDTIKTRYEVENWQRIARPIFDNLRRRQRYALVAHILHVHPEGFTNANQLFEYFLIDPGMEPVVQTSRLRLAISSAQTFVQRCLLNLEPQVHPSAIQSEHWQWMKRYRIWEANRKIFLYPENWLEPEFRDDKSHLFQELESELLQEDVSNDKAEDAFFRYLKSLERLAHLEIVTMYQEEGTLHVIGRTRNTEQPDYFYRRYASHMWTPWEPVDAEIEGDHVVAVVWRERLHLFWVTFVDKPPPEPEKAPDKTSADARPTSPGVESHAKYVRDNLSKRHDPRSVT